jgi:NAD(P)H-hydrate epimerase
MRRADEATIAAGTPADVLMERAGRAVARYALRMAGRRYGARTVVVCGPGNNGGDGYVAARFLQTQGSGVICVATSEPSDSGGPAKTSLERFLQAGGVVQRFHSGSLRRADVIVDAIFGTGFHGSPEGTARDAILAIAAARGGMRDPSGHPAPKVLSVDVPSGAGGDGPVVGCDLTVALGAEKLETAVAADPSVVEVADIGIEIPTPSAWIAEPEDMTEVAHRHPDSHKWMNSVAILAGSDAMTGAAILATRAAFRAGAGYVTLGTTGGVERIARGLVPEAVVRAVSATGVLSPDSVDTFADALGKAGAVAIGPGIGTGDDQRGLVRRILQEVEQPVVLDADGLNVMQEDPEALRARTAPLVITPHTGELARLLGKTPQEVQTDRVAAVQEAGERFGCTVVLKGPHTLTYRGDRGMIVNPTGGSELATAGTGDVLTGVLAALAAGGQEAFKPAWQAAYLHGLAGAIASGERGQAGLVAWDVAEALPRAITRLSPA